MQPMMNELDVLAARIGQGSPAAAAQLRQRLEPEMVRIVGRALRSAPGGSPTALTRQILARAKAVAPAATWGPGENREGLIRAVARDLCESVLGRLSRAPRPGGHALETVRA